MQSPGDKRTLLARAKLYLVTDASRPGLESFLDDVLEAGVDIVQLREKTLEASQQIDVAKIFRGACDRHDALFVVNDRVDIALACDADGVHLGQDDLPPSVARGIAGPELLIGRSTHSPAQVDRALIEDADYLACGPVFETPTKPGRPATGLSLIEYAAARSDKPWFAIGGIDPENISQIASAGASRIAVVRAIGRADSPADVVTRLKDALPSRSG